MPFFSPRSNVRAMPSNAAASLRRKRPIVIMLVLLVVSVLITAFVTWNALLIQSGVRAFVHGEGLWSKGQQRSVFYAELYAESGSPADLQLAREALSVPLADYDARLALERTPMDLDRARNGLRAGGNLADDTELMIWLYRYLSRAPYLKAALATWQSSDEHLLRLRQLIDRLETIERPASPALLEPLRQELRQIDRTLRPLAQDFSRTLIAGEKALRLLLVGASVLTLFVFLLLGGLAIIRLLKALEFAQNKFHTAFMQAAIGMAEVTPDGRFVEVNDTLCMLLRYSREQLIGTRFQAYSHPDDVQYSQRAAEHLGSGSLRSLTFEKRYIRSDGETVWARITATAVRNQETAPPLLFSIVEDITQARQLSEELHHKARHDSLTGLLNRREFEQLLQQAVESAQRTNHQHVLAFIDLDQFKVVNDTCGHVSGDHMLCQVALVLCNNLREHDVLARLGGDEFAVLFHETAIDGARQAVEKLHKAINAYSFHWQGRTFGLSSSIGLAIINRSTPDAIWALQTADTACTLAKNSGRAQIQLYIENEDSSSGRRKEMEWVSAIRSALNDNRMSLHAQMILDTRARLGYRYEIRICLTDTEGIQHPPGAFFPAAERSGLIGELDLHVLTRTLQLLAAHPLHLKLLDTCHIKVSGHSIISIAFRQRVKETLLASGLDCSKICFGLNETAAVTHLHDALAFIDDVRRLGCQVSLDDFGSNLSSFGYLKTLPIDLLKLDRALTDNIQTDAQSRAIVHSITRVAQALRKTTIAEFVEQQAALPILQDLGVRYIQGFAIHHPEPFEDLLTNLQQPPTTARFMRIPPHKITVY